MRGRKKRVRRERKKEYKREKRVGCERAWWSYNESAERELESRSEPKIHGASGAAYRMALRSAPRCATLVGPRRLVSSHLGDARRFPPFSVSTAMHRVCRAASLHPSRGILRSLSRSLLFSRGLEYALHPGISRREVGDTSVPSQGWRDTLVVLEIRFGVCIVRSRRSIICYALTVSYLLKE